MKTNRTVSFIFYTAFVHCISYFICGMIFSRSYVEELLAFSLVICLLRLLFFACYTISTGTSVFVSHLTSKKEDERMNIALKKMSGEKF